MENKGFTTRLVHSDRILNSPESGAVHQATNNSVLFEYENAQDLVDVFQGKKAGHVYSRSSSGSNAALQNMRHKQNLESKTCAFTFPATLRIHIPCHVPATNPKRLQNFRLSHA